MFSSTLALFTRSFRVDARSTQPHILRLVFAGVILFVLFWIQKMEFMFGAPGLTVFTWISWLNFAVISLAGLGYFATAISEEKEEDSLGLLKMAGISPVALLLGKSTTRLIAVLLMLAVEFPFVLLSITLGGVTMTQVIAMAAAIAAYLVFIANLGLICSVVGPNSRRSSTLMTLTLVVILMVFPWFATFGTYWATTHPQDTLIRRSVQLLARWENDISMWTRINVILSTGFSESAISRQVLWHVGAALGFFGLSWALFERFTRETHALRPMERLFRRQAAGRSTSQSSQQPTGPATGELIGQPVRQIASRSVPRMGRPWGSALAWKDFYFISGGMKMVVLRSIGYFALIGGLTLLFSWGNPGGPGLEMIWGGVAMTTMLIFGALELGLVASRVYREEVKNNTLPLLMMLPVSAGRIALSKAASAGPVIIPTVCFFLLGALFDANDFARAFKNVVTSWAGWYAIAVFVVFLHLAAYLSLIVKWGALPLAVFAIFFVHMFGSLMLAVLAWAPQREEPTFFMLTVAAIAVIFVLARAIPRRLRALAGR